MELPGSHPATGAELWSDLVAAPAVSIPAVSIPAVSIPAVSIPAVSNPAVLTHEGADYVVWAVGGNSILKPQVADQVVAYRPGTP